MALKKTCKCGTIIDYTQSMCPKCEKEMVERKRKERPKYDKKYDMYKRDKESQRFYNSREWVKTSEYIRFKFNYMCARCFSISGAMIGADVVHHIIPLKEDYSVRIDESNLICLCHGCHNGVHGEMLVSRDKVIRELKDIVNNWN